MTSLLPLAVAASVAAGAEFQTLDARRYHLRSGTNAEWEEFSSGQPHGRRLDIPFSARRTASEQTLLIWQDDVKQDWRVELNGRRLGSLFLMEAPLNLALRLPPGALQEGSNTLSIVPPRENDDARVGDVRLAPQPMEPALNECAVEIAVSRAGSNSRLRWRS